MPMGWGIGGEGCGRMAVDLEQGAIIYLPAESTGEAMAWMGLVIAVAPVVIGILVHHNLVSPKLATMLAGVVAMGGTVPTDAAAA